MIPRPADILNRRWAASVLLYLLENGSCRKTDLYRGIARSDSIHGTLDALQDAGPLTLSSCGGRTVTVALTPKGARAAEHLKGFEDVLLSIFSLSVFD